MIVGDRKPRRPEGGENRRKGAGQGKEGAGRSGRVDCWWAKRIAMGLSLSVPSCQVITTPNLAPDG